MYGKRRNVMHAELETAIRCWQVAHRLAKENPKLLLHGGREGARIAQERMTEVSKAEKGLKLAISAIDPSEVPVSLAEWLATYPVLGTDSGCGNCWFSSAGDEQKHPECVEKIKRFFTAVKGMCAL
jgi:hypothetical protein